MSPAIIWWVGAIHLAAYAIVGTSFVVTWTIWKVHVYNGFMRRILQWHYARARWQRREIAEEPQP